MKISRLLKVASAAFFIAHGCAFAQSTGTGPTDSIPFGKGAAVQGYTWRSLGNGLAINGSTLITSLPQNAVSGSSLALSSTNCGQFVERSNSGTAMTDTLPASPPTAGCVFAIQNTDSSAIYGVKAGGSTKLDGTTNGYTLLGPGQSTSVQSDGSNYFSVSKPTRAKLAAGTTVTFFLAASACNDANMAITAGSPWCTVQQCWNYTQANIDIGNNKAGTGILCQLADGTYTSTNNQGGGTAALNAQGSLTGQNTVVGFTIQGNCTTPTNTLINVAGTVILADDYAALAITCVEVQTGVVGGPIFVSQHKAFLEIADKVTVNGGAQTGNIFQAQLEGAIIQFGTTTIINGTGSAVVSASNKAYVEIDGSFTFTTATVAYIHSVSDHSLVYANNTTYSGSPTVTNKYALSFLSELNTAGHCSAVPGSSTSVDSTSICH